MMNDSAIALQALRATDSDVVQLSQQQMIFAQGARGHISANNVNMFPKMCEPPSVQLLSVLDAALLSVHVSLACLTSGPNHADGQMKSAAFWKPQSMGLRFLKTQRFLSGW